MSKQTIWPAHLALFVVSILYGVNYFISKAVFDEVPPLAMVVIRSCLGTLIIWLIAHFARPSEVIQSRKDWGLLVLCGILGASLNQIFFFLGLAHTLQVNAAVLMTSTPLFVFLTAFFLRTERLSVLKILGLVLALFGAVFISLNGRRPELGMDTIWGDGMVVLNAASYGLYLVLVQPLMRRYHILTVIKWVFLFGALNNIIFGAHELGQVDWPNLSNQALASIAYVVVGVTLLAYGLNAWALQRISASAVGIYIYLQPVIVAILAQWLNIEQLTGPRIGFMAMVLGGVYLVSYRKNRRQTTSKKG